MLVAEVGDELSLQASSFLMCSSAHCWYTWLYNNIPDNQCQLFRAPSVFYFSDNSLILCYSSCFVFYSHYVDSISSKKLNGHHAFESTSLLEALIDWRGETSEVFVVRRAANLSANSIVSSKPVSKHLLAVMCV